MQSLGARYAHGEVTLAAASELGCRACGSPGGGCQFLGTAATSQVVAEALGLTLPHAALAPSGQPIWLDMARRSARALMQTGRAQAATSRHHDRRLGAQCLGRACRLWWLDQPAVARAGGGLCAPACGVRRSTTGWPRTAACPRLVDALPNGPVGHPTVQVFLAGGVPEVMLHLRDAGLLDLERA